MKNKLELTWFNKDKSLYYDMKKGEYIWVDRNDPRVGEPRILIEKKSYGDSKAENLLIKGDNLLALKALQPEFTGRIKLVYIDPPFNTGTAFEHYDDGLEHSIWLTMMRDRLEVMKDLLKEDGVIFVHIDDNEQAHLRILLDEIFGEDNFITTICVKMSHASGVKMAHKEKKPPKIKEYMHFYAKNKEIINIKPQYEKVSWERSLNRYKSFIVNKDKEIKSWKVIPLRQAYQNFSSGEKLETFCIKNSDKIFRTAINRAELFRKIKKENHFSWHITKRGHKILIFHGEQVLFAKDKLISDRGEFTPVELLGDIWLDIGINNLANEGSVDFRFGKKPEKLIWRLIDMITTEGDFVLDSFAGSGTTGAVAHKMNRRWIMIELGEHAESHCLKRLKDVVNGRDQAGISKEVNWKGGGGFKYCVLGDSLFEIDKQLWFPFINSVYTNGPLIRAVCKMEGFRVLDSKGVLHGQVNKKYAHITEQFVNQVYIEEVSKEIKNDEFLTIYCLKHDSRIELSDNIAIKRLPMALTKKFVIG